MGDGILHQPIGSILAEPSTVPQLQFLGALTGSISLGLAPTTACITNGGTEDGVLPQVTGNTLAGPLTALLLQPLGVRTGLIFSGSEQTIACIISGGMDRTELGFFTYASLGYFGSMLFFEAKELKPEEKE